MVPPIVSSSSAAKGFNGTPSKKSPIVTVPSTMQDESVRLGGNGDVSMDGFIRLSSLTHDTFIAMQHTSIKRLGEDLQSAVQAAWPKQDTSRYTKVSVLLLSWVTDDLGVASEVQRLQHVFEDMYKFQVETYQIPDEKPDRALKGRILEFLKNDLDDSLLVIYYAGHARRGPQSNEGPLWFPNRQNTLTTVPSSGIQTLLEEADSDVLLLYDCCHSAAITTTGCFQGNKGVKEVIAACGYETIAPEVDKHSFTNALVETLALASKGPPFSVGELHSRVLSRLKCWTASLLYDKYGKILETPDGNLAYEHQPRRTPIYSILRESKSRRSIVLAPLTPAQPTRVDEPRASPNITEAVASPDPGLDGKTVPSKKSKKRKRPAAEEPKWPQIVLSVRLDEAELDRSTWREWIRALPAEGKDIKIEGVYKSFSMLLLIRMPVSVWNLLPKNEAYSFVGYVTSENLGIATDPENNPLEPLPTEKTQSTKNEPNPPEGVSSVQDVSKDIQRESFGKGKDVALLASRNDDIYLGSGGFQPSLPPSHTTSKSRNVHLPSALQSSQDLSNTAALPSSSKRRGKGKTHVTSACVPCKRAHLRCDVQRPCSRCLATGKEDACVKVQHETGSRQGSPAKEEYQSSAASTRPSLSIISPTSPRVNEGDEGSLVHLPGPKSQEYSPPPPLLRRPEDMHFHEQPAQFHQPSRPTQIMGSASLPHLRTLQTTSLQQPVSEAGSVEQWPGPAPWSPIPAAETNVDALPVPRIFRPGHPYPDRLEEELDELEEAMKNISDEDGGEKRKKRAKRRRRRHGHRSRSRDLERDERPRGGGGGGPGGSAHGITVR
ncbi:hypothetical protein BGZ57DRAFT_953345 [Hyaloscypha finlandica]|nr:hypothetical protein BGZ57DRAFT_953345 [Hyaloscypha finlandica]